jgi:Fumarylacetoacetase N-terminal
MAQTSAPDVSGFSVANLPFGVFRDRQTDGSICVAFGGHLVDVKKWSAAKLASEQLEVEVSEALQQVRSCRGMIVIRCDVM